MKEISIIKYKIMSNEFIPPQKNNKYIFVKNERIRNIKNLKEERKYLK